MKQTAHPNEAFTAYQYLISNKNLLHVYGAMPAIKSMQADFFAGLDQKFAPVKPNWQVAIAVGNDACSIAYNRQYMIIDARSGHYFDDTKRYVDAISGLSDEARSRIYALNALRVYPRLKNRVWAQT